MVLFFLNASAITEIYTLSLHDALPILVGLEAADVNEVLQELVADLAETAAADEVQLVGRNHLVDRKSTRLNSSHTVISYAVFCLKKKTRLTQTQPANSTL